MHGRNSLKYDKLEDEYEGESEHYQNEGDVRMCEMFSVWEKHIAYYLPENLQLHSNQGCVQFLAAL